MQTGTSNLLTATKSQQNTAAITTVNTICYHSLEIYRSLYLQANPLDLNFTRCYSVISQTTTAKFRKNYSPIAALTN